MPAVRKPPAPGPDGLDPRILKALAHPLRYRLLARLNVGVASPAGMARELGLPIGRVSHHVRTLAGIGAIELVRTRPRRGAIEHFYRAVVPAWFTDEDWARVPASVRDAIGRQNVEQVLRDLARAAPDSFRHPSAHLSFLPLELDELGMQEMSALLTETLARAAAIESESVGRGAEATRSTQLVLLHFERPPSP
jgi:DNA-binding transcriptional ArsR family regulator